MGDLMREQLGKVHASEVAVMLFVFGKPRFFSFAPDQSGGLNPPEKR
jgi:hypothetical protein